MAATRPRPISETDQRERLVVHDALVGRMRRYFDVVIDPNTVNAVYLNDGTDLEPIVVQRFPLSGFVDATGLDWAQWRRVVVEVTYVDEEHGFRRTKVLDLEEEADFRSVEFDGFSSTLRAYEFKAFFVPLDPSTTDPLEVSDLHAGLLLLQTLL